MKKPLILLAPGFVLTPVVSARSQSEDDFALLNWQTDVSQTFADPVQGEPYFHQLTTPSGTLLTELRQTDHAWHRDLWFSWRNTNGLNFREEEPEKHNAEGATALHGKSANELNFLTGINPPAVTILDDPQNPPHPSPRYENQQVPFFSPALLSSYSLTLAPGARVVLNDKMLTTDHDTQEQVMG